MTTLGTGEKAFTTPSSVVEAVTRDLEAIHKRAPELASSALAASALALAREMDGDNSATSKSMCGRALLDVMDRLRELCPPEKKANALDAIRAKRAADLEGAPRAAN